MKSFDKITLGSRWKIALPDGYWVREVICAATSWLTVQRVDMICCGCSWLWHSLVISAPLQWLSTIWRRYRMVHSKAGEKLPIVRSMTHNKMEGNMCRKTDHTIRIKSNGSLSWTGVPVTTPSPRWIRSLIAHCRFWYVLTLPHISVFLDFLAPNIYSGKAAKSNIYFYEDRFETLNDKLETYGIDN